MANVRVITNNPIAAEKYPAAEYTGCGVEGIFTVARDAVHRGAVLIGHPLSGSVKPNESPYKSLVISAGDGAVDMDSLNLIESALAVLRKLPPRNRRLNQQILEDFMVIDLDLLDSAIVSLPPQYHL